MRAFWSAEISKHKEISD